MDNGLSNATSDLNELNNRLTSSGSHVLYPIEKYLKILKTPFTTCHCEGTPSPDVNTMIREIYAAVVTETANKTDAINILKQAIEDRQCPTDDCKKCQYYVPGGVDKCDTTRALAEYLIYNNIVKVNKPDSVDKSEK